MADLERRIQTLQRAVRAFRQTPGRRGRVIRLAGASEVLVAGDLHGHLENFRHVLTLADLARQPRRHLVLQEVVHGPRRYPGGGDRSHQLLDLVAALKVQFPERVHFLLGNHELAQATGRRVGRDTAIMNDLFRAGIDEAYGDRSSQVYALYLELFAAAPLAVRTANRVFVSHSLPPAARLACFDPAALDRDTPTDLDVQPTGSIYALVWGRDTSPAAAAGFLKVVDADLLITGHVPCDRGFDFPNQQQVILDCQDSPAGYCLFPADRRLSPAELVDCVSTL
jgi:hypothetical protein